MNDHHEIGRGFSDRHAKTSDVFGQTRLRDRNAVLNQHLSLIDVHPWLEDDVDRNPSVSGRLRGDIEHVVNAIDFLLDGRRHGRRDDFGGGARVAGADIHRRWRDFWIFRDRQGALCDGAGDCQEDERTAAKIGRSMKKWESRIRILRREIGLFSSQAAAMMPSCGVTRTPAARTDWRGRRSRPGRFGQGPTVRRASLHGFDRAAPASPQFCFPVSP